MKKTGNSCRGSLRFTLLVLLLLSGATLASAQGINVEASVSENRVFTGEQFQLSIEISGTSVRDVGLPVLPEIEGFRVLSTTPSRSTSISIVNGETSASTTYTYTLIARGTGHYTIPPATVTIDNEELKTQPIQVEVIEKGNLSAEGQPQMPDIFLEVEVDDETPVTGQQIVAAVVIYFKQGIEVTSFQPSSGWRTDGFWKEELNNVRQPRAETVILGGVRYRRATLIRYALFPTRSGELTLNEFTLNAGIRTQPSRNDPFGSFFGGPGTNHRRVSLESDPVTLQVQSLPPADRGIVINAVGDMQVQRALSRQQITAGETLELITTVEGAGNIPLVRKPDYQLPDQLELYSPQENSNVQRMGETIQGEKVFTELMAARVPGSYQIPSVDVAVYNPQNRRYRFVTLPAISFEVLPGENTQIAGSGRSSLRLQPVSGLAAWHPSSTLPFYQTFWFWILIAIPMLATAAALYNKTLQDKLSSDSDFARSHRAYDTAKKRITEAEKNIENPKQVYGYLHKTITGFISDKLGFPVAGYSDDELLNKLRQHGTDTGILKKTRNLLTKCATISYAPVGGRENIRSDIEKTRELITELKKVL